MKRIKGVKYKVTEGDLDFGGECEMYRWCITKLYP